MKCQQVNKYILAYCDNDLPPELVNKIEKHIIDCNNCAANIALTKLENSILNNLPMVEPSDNFTANVMQKVFVTTPENYSPKFLSKKAIIFAVPIATILLIFLATSLPSFINLSNNTPPSNISEKESLGEYTTPYLQNYNDSISDGVEQKYNENNIDKPNKVEKIDTNNLTPPTDKEIIVADINNYDELQKKNLGDSSSRSQFLKSSDHGTPDTELLGNIDLTIYNIPANYTLANIKNISYNEVTYQYIDSANDTSIAITLAKIDDHQATDKKEEQFPLMLNLSDESNIIPVDENEHMNEYSYEITNDEDLYLITLQSSLPKEELIHLSSNITITK